MKSHLLLLITILWAGVAGAELLVEETWDYTLGSDSETWTGGVGLNATAWDPAYVNDTSAFITNGLSLGTMPVSGNACHVSFAGGDGVTAATMRRYMDTSTVDSGDLWVSYLVSFDTVGSTVPDDEKLEIRTSLTMRTGIHENSPTAYIRTGSDTSYTSSYEPIKDGSTVLYVAKFSDMGSATGADAKCWIISAAGYDSMVTNGGISEINLDAYAEVSANTTFEPNLVMSGTTSIDVAPIARDGSTPSYTFDELRYGTTVNDVVIGPEASGLLVEETWDYALGSDSSAWIGGVGMEDVAWDPAAVNDTSAFITNGLSLGTMPVSGNACHVSYSAGVGVGGATLRRYMDTTTVGSGDLWVSYLVAFDTARSTVPDDEKFEIRTSLDMRTGIHENSPTAYVRSGADTSYTSSYEPIKDGTTVLYVAKFADMGSATGTDAKCWVLTAAGYDNMIAGGGVSETNLDSYAVVAATNSFEANLVMSGTTYIDVVPVGRDGSTPAFTFDELRYGVSIEDVIAVPSSGELNSASLQIKLSDGLMLISSSNLTVSASHTLQVSTNLIAGSWSNVLPAVTGVSVTNWMIDPVDSAIFFRITSER